MFECFLCVESFRPEAFSEAIVSKFDYSNVPHKETLLLCSPSSIDIDAGFCSIDVATNFQRVMFILLHCERVLNCH